MKPCLSCGKALNNEVQICPDCGFEFDKPPSPEEPGSVYHRGWLHFDCADCGRNHKVRYGRAGYEGRCRCGATMVVPAHKSFQSGQSIAKDLFDFILYEVGCLLFVLWIVTILIAKSCE